MPIRCAHCGASGDAAEWDPHESLEWRDNEAPLEPFEAIGGSPTLRVHVDDPSIPAKRMEWTIRRFAWMLARRGIDDLRSRPLILPDSSEVLEPWTPDREGAEQLFSRLLDHAGISHGGIELTFFDQSGDQGGHYSGARRSGERRIAIGADTCTDSRRLRSVLSHEIAHDWLYRIAGLEDRPLDNEGLTDLATAFLGIGVLRLFDRLMFDAHQRVSERKPSLRRYLSGDELMLGISIHLVLSGLPEGIVTSHVRPAAASILRRAVRWLSSRSDLLRTLEFSPADLLAGVEWIQKGQ
ncbi:MAG: hypothetical protein HYR85_15515 [Planctomycetes bacterium]|nr:hypothetical protein [Planctomycetota bacterium]MBI3846643.1 hypothetical protein [Planctomycetota bacterium]